MAESGWYSDPSGSYRYWNESTGWTQDIVGPSGVPTIDPRPTPVSVMPGLRASWIAASPLTSTARSTQAGSKVSPFPVVPVSGGCGLLLIISFPIAALTSWVLPYIYPVVLAAAAIVGVVAGVQLRRGRGTVPVRTIKIHATLLLLSSVLSMFIVVGLIGLGFSIAALRRMPEDPQRARGYVLRGWAGMGVGLMVVSALLVILVLLQGGGAA
jgi:hypothetical protein